MRIYYKILFIIMISLSIFGCSANNKTTDPNDSLHGKILITGSTSVFPIIEGAADVFSDKHKSVTVEAQGTGSSAGIKDAYEKNSDIGMTSRELSADEKSYGLTETKIAVDGIAIIVNTNNPIKDLTKEQLRKIFNGEIKNWKELGWEDKTIKVITREEGSGTRSALEEGLDLIGENKRSLITIDAQVCSGTGAIRQGVAVADEAIGYISLGIADESVRVLKIDEVECTETTVRNGDYLLSRDFTLVYDEISDEAKAFIDFILSNEGQEIVKEHGAISVD